MRPNGRGSGGAEKVRSRLWGVSAPMVEVLLLVPTIVRDAPYSGIYLLFYNRLKQTSLVTDSHDPNTRSLALFLCGLVSGAAATVDRVRSSSSEFEGVRRSWKEFE